MKLIIEITTSRVKYAFDQSCAVVLSDSEVRAYDAAGDLMVIISDMNEVNSRIVNAGLPDGETLETFVGDKYLFEGAVLLSNPDYVPPPVREEEFAPSETLN